MLAEQIAAIAISIILGGALFAGGLLAFRASNLALAYTGAVQGGREIARSVMADVRESQSAVCGGSSLELDGGRVVYSYDGRRVLRSGVPFPYMVESVSFACSPPEVSGELVVVERRFGGWIRRRVSFAASMRIVP